MRAQKRFHVALSFPGERRAFVENVATLLSGEFGQDRVLYDKYHEAELARLDLDVYLPNLYQKDAELIVLFLCAEYSKKRWCKLEWRSIRQLICTSNADRIMFVSFDDIGAVPEIGIYSGDGYVSIGNRTPQEVADLIQQRLRVNAGTDTSSVSPDATESPTVESDLVVDSSGSWLMLSNRFYTAQNVHHHSDGSVTAKIVSTDSETDAAIRGLRPAGSGQPPTVAFAHRNDACYALVKNVEAESKGDDNLWILTLRPAEFGGGIMSEIAYGGQKPLSADDIAKMRASRILLNDPPEVEQAGKEGSAKEALTDGMVEVLIRGINTPLHAKACVLRSLYPSLKENPRLFLQLSRLAAIFALKASCAVEHVLKLSLGPLEDGVVRVHFRGVRRKTYSNVEPTIIELEGNCRLI